MDDTMYSFGFPLKKRETIIQEAIVNAHETTKILYRGKYRDLPVIEVPIGLPVYRIENIRTKSMHAEWLATHPDRPKDFFTKEPSSIEVQEEQHKLLHMLADDQGLLKTFRDTKEQQTLPLICSDDGVVVNGNRRLCVWRDLYSFDHEKFKHFETINIAVLPDHDPKGMYDLEVSLQIKKDMKADYLWHAIAADCKEKAETIDRNELAKNRSIKVEDVNQYIDCFNYATDYLYSIGHAGEWSLVDKAFYAFQQILSSRKSLSNSGDKAIFKEITNSLIMVPNKGERLYTKIPKVAKNLNQISSKLKEAFDIDPEQYVDRSDPLNIENDDNEHYKNSIIARCVREAQDPDKVVNIVDNVLQTCEEEERENNKKTYLFSQVQRAATILANAISTIDESMETNGVIKQIESIEGSCLYIKKWIGND